jgi:hypothetical protein
MCEGHVDEPIVLPHCSQSIRLSTDRDLWNLGPPCQHTSNDQSQITY